MFDSNNIKSYTFNIINNKLNTTPTTINSFENDSDELHVLTSSTYNTHLWQRGVPYKTLLNTVGTGVNAYTTNLVGEYSNSTISYLYTNCYDLTTIATPILKFKMSFDIEENWDYMNIEYSTDKGTSWSILGDATDPNWYNSSYTNSEINFPGKQWTGEGENTNALGGTNATLHDYSYNLSAFTNEPSIFFRFKFFADDAANEEGVIIDDLVIEGTLLSVDKFNPIQGLSIYPNPSSTIFNIDWQEGSKFSISVFDLTGKLILEKKNISQTTNHFELNMTKYIRGIYFAKITVDDNQATKKIILR